MYKRQSRARSRPRPRCCWRRRRRHRRGLCRRRRRTPTCCPRWRCRRAWCRDRRRTPRSRRTPRCRGRRAGTACPSLYLEATARRRHRTRRSRGPRGRRILGTGRRDTRTARRRRAPGRIPHSRGRGRRTSRARRRGLLSTESLRSGCYFPTMLLSHVALVSGRLYNIRLWLLHPRGGWRLRVSRRPRARLPRERPHHMSGEDATCPPHES